MNLAVPVRANPFESGAPDWFPWWRGETCVIVAAGPTAKDAPLDIGKGRVRFIAVNRSVDLTPWADIWYGCDFSFWNHVKGGPGFPGMKMSIDARACRTWPTIRHVDCRKGDDRLVLDKFNRVGWGGNSGFHAINLAVQFGVARIVLVGFDMCLTHGVHWHGRHPEGMNNPKSGNIERWRRSVDNAAKSIAAVGVEVVNCSPISRLQNYPKMTLEEALQQELQPGRHAGSEQ